MSEDNEEHLKKTSELQNDSNISATTEITMTSVIPKISKLSKRVIRVLGCNPGFFTLQGTNTYIIGTGPDRMLIDTGERDVLEYIENLKNVVQENKISLTKILLTHWHPDHVGGTSAILKQVAHKDCKVFKYPEAERDPVFSRDEYELNYLKDGEEISVEGATLKVYHTPGHAKDHLVMYLKEEDNLFSGDCILGEGSCVFEDLISYLESLEKIGQLNSKRIYPGHGPVVMDPKQKVQEYIEKRLEREEHILKQLEKSKDSYVSVEEIVNNIYPNLPNGLIFGAQWNVFNHLKKLLKEGRVEKIENDDDGIGLYRIK